MGGSLVVLVAWEAVAHSSGSGWVQAIGALAAAFLVVGMVAPGLVVRRVPPPIVTAPPDATAGRSVELTVTVTAPLQVLPVHPPGPSVTVAPGAPAVVPVVPTHRGVIEACVLDIASAAPFGLLWWHRSVVVPLPRLLAVAPRQGRPDPAALAEDGRGDDGALRPHRTGEPRGVRAYQPGDPRRQVHWPASAHAGGLMVRETEGPAGQPVTVRVTLPDDVDQAERVAERALGTVVALLARGRPVELATTETAGERVGPVAGALEAGRRLAFARPRGSGSADPHRLPGP